MFKLSQKFQADDNDAQQTIMTNIYLNETEYRTLIELGGPTITKRRYKYHYDGDDYSIDVFEGHLRGLTLAEIEGHAERQFCKLPKPAFVIREVTDDPQFTGGELVKLSQEEFQRWMEAW